MKRASANSRWMGRLLPVLALLLLVQSATPLAQDNGSASADERPVYIDIMPVAGAGNSILPDDAVAAMASEALSNARQTSTRMSGQTLPAGVRVLRVMYIVHQQPDGDGMTFAASASTELLRTDDRDHDGVVQTFSIYNGMQQTLVQAPNRKRGQPLLRAAFKKELQARISSAFQNSQAL